MRRYAVALLQGFFRKKADEIGSEDLGRVLRGVYRHINRHILEEWRVQERGLDLVLTVADTSRAYAARSGGGTLFLYRGEEAREVFGGRGGHPALLGTGAEENMQMDETSLQPGDILVLCNPELARIMGVRDMTLILRRAPDISRAALFLGAIAERKGAGDPVTALLWEVPNLRGAAMLTEEQAPKGEAGGDRVEGEGSEVEQADQAKRQWLSLWRRRKG